MKSHRLRHTVFFWSLIIAGLIPQLALTQTAEPCVDYQQILQNLAKAEKAKEFGKALKELSALRACAPEQTDVIDAGYERVFAAIARLNEEFKSAKDKAQLQEARALNALAEAKKQRQAADDARAAAEEQARNVFLNELDNQLAEEADSLLAMKVAAFAYHYVDSLHPVVRRSVTEAYYKLYQDAQTNNGLNSALKWIEESPDGRLTALANSASEIMVVRNDTSVLVDYRPLIGKGEPIDLAWSPDSRGLAVTTSIGYVAYWRLGEADLTFEMEMEYPLVSIDESPQGNLWAVGSTQGLFYLLNKEGVISRHNAHIYAIAELAFSPDGKRLATVSFDGIGKIWTLGQMDKPVQLLGHNDYIRDLSWSPDGASLLTVADDEQAIFWNTTTGEATLAMQTEAGAYLLASAWHPTNDLVAIGDQNGKVAIWEAGDTSRRYELEPLSQIILSLQWTKGGTLLQILADNSLLPLYWSLSEQAFVDAPQAEIFELLKLSDQTDQWTVSWRPKAGDLAAGYQDGNVWIWRDVNQLPQSLDVNHDNGIWELAYSPDGSILAVVSPGDISLYQADQNYALREAFGTRASNVCLVWHPNGRELLLGDTEGFVKTYDVELADFVEEKSWKLHTAQVRSLDFSPDGKYFLTASQDSSAVIFNYENGVIDRRIKGVHTHMLRDAVWSPDGSHFATGGDDRQIFIFSLENPTRPLHQLSRHESRILSLDWAADGRIASVSDRELYFWDGNTGDTLSTALYENLDRSDQISFRQDGVLALAANSISPVLVDINGKSTRLPGPVNPVTSLRESFALMTTQDQMSESAWEKALRSFSPNQIHYNRNGSLLALQKNEVQVIIFDGRTGERITQTDKAVQLTDLAWSPTEDKLVLSYKDNTALLYDFSKRPYTPQAIKGHLDWIRFVDWAPDGQHFVTGSDDNQLILWRVADGAKVGQYSPANQQYLMDGLWLKTNRIAVLDEAGTVYLLKINEKDTLFTKLEENVQHISATADRNYIIVQLGGDRPALLAFDSKTGANILLGNSASDPKALAFIPELESWIISFGDSRFRLQDIDSKVNLTANLGAGKITGILPSPAEHYVAIITDRELVIWNWEVEKDIFRFPVENLALSDLRWSPNGKLILYKEERETAFRLLDPGELLARAKDDLLDVSLQKEDIYNYNLSRLLPNDVSEWYPLFSRREKGPQLEAWGNWLSQQAQESVVFNPDLFRAAIRFYQKVENDRNASFTNTDLFPLYIELGKRWLQAGQVDSARQSLAMANLHAQDEMDLLDLQLPYYLQTKQREKALVAAALVRTRRLKPENFIRNLRRGTSNKESLDLRTQVFRMLTFDQVTTDDVAIFNILPPPHTLSLDQLIAQLPPKLQDEYRFSQEINRLKNTELAIDVFWQDYLSIWSYLQTEKGEPMKETALTDIAIRFLAQLSRMSPQESRAHQNRILAKLPPLSAELLAAISRISQQRFREISSSKDTETALAAGESFIVYTRFLQELDEYKEYLARGLAELAWVEMRADLLDSANLHLQEAFKINNANAIVLKRLGHYFLLSGDPERAMAFYQYILSDRPGDYPSIASELDQLSDAVVAPTRNQLTVAWDLRKKQQDLLNRINAIKDIYRDVDSDPKTNYLYLKQLTQAETQYRDLLTEYEGVPLFLEDKDLTDTTMALNLGNYSYYALFNEDFTAAVEAAEQSLELVPTNWVYTNYAHGYLYQGDWAQARPLYETTRLKADDSSNEQLVLADALLQDFVDLKAVGIWHKDVLRAAELILGRKLTKEEKQRYGKP